MAARCRGLPPHGPGPENGSPAARRQTTMRSARPVCVPRPPHALASTTEAWSACGEALLLRRDVLVQIFPRVLSLQCTLRYALSPAARRLYPRENKTSSVAIWRAASLRFSPRIRGALDWLQLRAPIPRRAKPVRSGRSVARPARSRASWHPLFPSSVPFVAFPGAFWDWGWLRGCREMRSGPEAEAEAGEGTWDGLPLRARTAAVGLREWLRGEMLLEQECRPKTGGDGLVMQWRCGACTVL